MHAACSDIPGFFVCATQRTLVGGAVSLLEGTDNKPTNGGEQQLAGQLHVHHLFYGVCASALPPGAVAWIARRAEVAAEPCLRAGKQPLFERPYSGKK